MGIFLREYYQGESIAVNDIGAVNYLADIRCLDLVGLGSLEVARAKMESNYNSQEIYELAESEQVRIAILYDHWFEGEKIGGIPAEWIKVGSWKILNNVVCAGAVVSFYAVDLAKKDGLATGLQQFSEHLPKNVFISEININ